MPLGTTVRRVLGPLEEPICNLYRSFFVDVRRCAAQIAPRIPAGATVLDVGGGDGAFLSAIMDCNQDFNAVMIDQNPDIGRFVSSAHAKRVEYRPLTSLETFAASDKRKFAVVTIFDVVHHVPAINRREFFSACYDLLEEGGILIVKDINPGRPTSFLSVASDRFITGDRHVSLLSAKDLIHALECCSFETRAHNLLDGREQPNYAVLMAKVRQAS